MERQFKVRLTHTQVMPSAGILYGGKKKDRPRTAVLRHVRRVSISDIIEPIKHTTSGCDLSAWDVLGSWGLEIEMIDSASLHFRYLAEGNFLLDTRGLTPRPLTYPPSPTLSNKATRSHSDGTRGSCVTTLETSIGSAYCRRSIKL